MAREREREERPQTLAERVREMNTPNIRLVMDAPAIFIGEPQDPDEPEEANAAE